MKETFLILLDNQTVVKKLPLGRGRFVIGRGNDVDFVLSSGEVSRHHAAIEYDGCNYTLTDLNSTNGTLVNGKKITQRAVSIGERISIGDHTLVIDDGSSGFSYPEETAARSAGRDTMFLERKFESLRKKLDSKMLHEEFKDIERAVKKSRQRLSDAAHVDALTGLCNRRYFEELAEQVLVRAAETSGTPAILFIDIDHFKKINDTHGHEKGDIVLASIARLIQISCRKTDIVARYGGEELVVMLQSSSKRDASIVANGINRVIREQSPTIVDLRVTVSIGIAMYPEHGTRLKEMIASADKALYRAKQSGRDAVCVG
jgi:diguanylate cyclase (GGDEF)-like protein